MLKPTGLLIATVVLTGLGGLVWWTNKHPATDSPVPGSASVAPKILTLKEDQIEGIRIVRPAAEPVVLTKTAGKWEVVGPKTYPGDPDSIKALTGSLATLIGDRIIDEHPGSLNEFGLTNPPEEIDVTVKGGTHKLLIGSDAPVGNATYVKLADKPAVYTLAAAVKSSFDKTADDLRDKHLLIFNQEKLTAIAIPPVEFGKNATGDWQIVKPKLMRADTNKVDDLIRKLHEAKGDATGKDRIATVSVTDDSGVHTLEVEKSMKDLAELVKDKSPDAFRNKKLFDFGFNNPTKIEIDGQSYDKSPQKDAIIDKLRDLSAVRFADTLKGTLALNMSVTTGKLEKVIINKFGSDYYAAREGDSTIYVLESKTFDDLKKAMVAKKP